MERKRSNNGVLIMNKYYDYYINTYNGSLTEEEFNKNKVLAEKYIKRYAPNLTNIAEKDLLLCISMLVDNININAIISNDNKVVSSRSAGSISESYVVSEKAKATDTIREIISLTLGIDCTYTCEWC